MDTWNDLTLAEYQQTAWEKAIYPDKGRNLLYPTLGLAGETGEVCEKVKKIWRDDNGVLDEARKGALLDEMGDVAWYLAALCSELDVSLESVLRRNLDKVRRRHANGTLRGSGDER